MTYKLSEKDLELLQSYFDHPQMSDKERATHLGVSPRMVEKRRQSIAKKYECPSFVGAVVMAMGIRWPT
jgi:DNA-binding CsgD family transcriptional regulator